MAVYKTNNVGLFDTLYSLAIIGKQPFYVDFFGNKENSGVHFYGSLLSSCRLCSLQKINSILQLVLNSLADWPFASNILCFPQQI